MRRWLFAIFSVASLVLCVVSTIGWRASYRNHGQLLSSVIETPSRRYGYEQADGEIRLAFSTDMRGKGQPPRFSCVSRIVPARTYAGAAFGAGWLNATFNPSGKWWPVPATVVVLPHWFLTALAAAAPLAWVTLAI